MMTPAPPRSSEDAGVLPAAESSVLAPLAREVDAYLTRVIRGRGLPEILEEAIGYSVGAGGKRLRPALTLLACEAVGGDRSTALAPAAALELIHTFSLVHDDLPAMDDDALRRGRPTLHVHAGEATAILAGDAMMTLAFELVAQTPVPDTTRAHIMRRLAEATTSMITGQIYDTLGGLPRELSDEQRLRLVHRNKTGALLAAACEIGGWCGQADEAAQAALRAYGEAIGLMFQIVDDVIDVTQTTEHVGKATGKDEDAGKLTYPGVVGLEASRHEVERLRTEATRRAAVLGDAGATLRCLADEMAVRTR